MKNKMNNEINWNALRYDFRNLEKIFQMLEQHQSLRLQGMPLKTFKTNQRNEAGVCYESDVYGQIFFITQ